MPTGSGPSESVIIHGFWSNPIVFHGRNDPGTDCDPENKRGSHRGCGHALPRRVAEQIARPCRRCYPTTTTKKD